MPAIDKWLPMEISAATAAFPAEVSNLMPPYKEIPTEFLHRITKWSDFVSDWVFLGVKIVELEPKEGIDKKLAMRHLHAIMGSFEPKHEHKEAAVAYLLSLWFKDVKWEKEKKTI